MDRKWMQQRLDYFARICRAYEERPPESDGSELLNLLYPEMPTAREILKRLDPTLANEIREPSHPDGLGATMRAALQGLGIVRDQESWQIYLQPDAPSLVADQFHAHVWLAASALWDTGQYRVAVGQAAISLSAHVAKKAESSLSDRRLVTSVFSTDLPKPGQNRLHLPGNRASDTWRSKQEGLHLLAQGAFAGIRNVAAHTDDEWSEHVALEHLSVLSVVARWTDQTEVMRAL